MASEPKHVGPPEGFDPTPRPITREVFDEVWEKSIPLEEFLEKRRGKQP